MRVAACCMMLWLEVGSIGLFHVFRFCLVWLFLSQSVRLLAKLRWIPDKHYVPLALGSAVGIVDRLNSTATEFELIIDKVQRHPSWGGE